MALPTHALLAAAALLLLASPLLPRAAGDGGGLKQFYYYSPPPPSTPPGAGAGAGYSYSSPPPGTPAGTATGPPCNDCGKQLPPAPPGAIHNNSAPGGRGPYTFLSGSAAEAPGGGALPLLCAAVAAAVALARR